VVNQFEYRVLYLHLARVFVIFLRVILTTIARCMCVMLFLLYPITNVICLYVILCVIFWYYQWSICVVNISVQCRQINFIVIGNVWNCSALITVQPVHHGTTLIWDLLLVQLMAPFQCLILGIQLLLTLVVLLSKLRWI
jgi:hypothetical protein